MSGPVDLYGLLTVGAMRRANRAVAAFFRERAVLNKVFDADAVVEVVIDALAAEMNPDADPLNALDYRK